MVDDKWRKPATFRALWKFKNDLCWDFKVQILCEMTTKELEK